MPDNSIDVVCFRQNNVTITGENGSVSPKHIKFPPELDVFPTKNLWSNEESMLRYIDIVLVLYIEYVKENLDLLLQQAADIIMDVFKAHRFACQIEGKVLQGCVCAIHWTCQEIRNFQDL